MISPPHARRDAQLRTYLLERYVAAEAASGLAALTMRAADLCADPDHPGAGPQYLLSAFLPAEDTCFCVFRATSEAAVRAVNDQAEFAYDRVTEADLLVWTGTAAPLMRRPS